MKDKGLTETEKKKERGHTLQGRWEIIYILHLSGRGAGVKY